MAREADVVRSLVEMADTLVNDFDAIDLLTGLADRCVSLLGVSAAGVMLASPAGRLGLAASSTEAMRLLELFELQAQEGPCLDAFRTGERVGPEGLAACVGRWPSFFRRRRRRRVLVGVRAALRLRDATLGALNLLSVDPGTVTEADLVVARAFADLAALSIVQHQASAEAQRLNEQLSDALTSRIVIEQAKGLIAERAGTGLAEAFSRLRGYACNHNRRLTDVAQAAIDAPWTRWPGPRRPGRARPGRACRGRARPGRAGPAGRAPPLANRLLRIILRVGERCRATLTSTAAAATSLRGGAATSGGWMRPTRRWNAVRVIRGQLGLPPPATS